MPFPPGLANHGNFDFVKKCWTIVGPLSDQAAPEKWKKIRKKLPFPKICSYKKKYMEKKKLLNNTFSNDHQRFLGIFDRVDSSLHDILRRDANGNHRHFGELSAKKNANFEK